MQRWTPLRWTTMTHGIRDQTAIVGMAQTPFAKGLEDSELSLACQAIAAAI